jgi:hypothetical protein
VTPKPKRVADWHWQALALWSKGDNAAAIAELVGKHPKTVEAVLYSAWGKEQRREIESMAAQRGRLAAVDPIVKAQAAAPRMMDRMIEACETAEKPLDIATIADKVLAHAGYVPVAKSVHLNLEGRIRDRAAISDEMLMAFANGGEIPDALKGLLVLPAGDDNP